MTRLAIPEFSTIEEILEYAMKEEQEAYEYYIEAAGRIADPDMKQFLIHLAELEVEHYNNLKEKLESYRANHFSAKGIMASFDENL